MTIRGSSPASWGWRALGALALLAGLGVGLRTERDAAVYREAPLAGLGGEARPAAGLGSAQVRVSGTPTVAQPPRDAEFGQQADAPVLVRHVEMFQWREVRVGDQAHYEQDWVDHPVDSAGFSHPQGHANPGGFPIEGKQFDAGEVRLGRFVLAPELVHALPGSEPLAPDMHGLPGNLAASFSLHGNSLVTSADPGRPRLGDLRVSWETVPLQPVTIFARAAGDGLVPAPQAGEDKGYQVLLGERAPEDVLPPAPAAARDAGWRRALAFALAVLGAWLALHRSPRPGAGDLPLAVALGVLALGTVGGVAWLGHDGRVAAAWLVLAAIGLAGSVWRLRRRPG
jgi:hypothetical protein